MRHFTTMQIEAAYAYAMAGGQALHTHRVIVYPDRAPPCFVRAVERGEDIAHLLDQDADRLKATAQMLGVRVVVIELPGTKLQHIGLCGEPLRTAMKMCESSD